MENLDANFKVYDYFNTEHWYLKIKAVIFIKVVLVVNNFVIKPIAIHKLGSASYFKLGDNTVGD